MAVSVPPVQAELCDSNPGDFFPGVDAQRKYSLDGRRWRR